MGIGGLHAALAILLTSVLAQSPVLAAPSRDFAYVTHRGAPIISVIDLEARAIVESMSVGGGAGAVVPAAGRAYLPGFSEIQVFDLHKRITTSVSCYTSGDSPPPFLTATPDGRLLLRSGTYEPPGWVGVVDAATRERVGSFKLPLSYNDGDVSRFVFSADSRFAYTVVNRLDEAEYRGVAFALDLETFEIVGAIDLPDASTAFTVLSGGRLLVGAQGFVMDVDFGSGEVHHRVDVDGYVTALAIDSTGERVYAAVSRPVGRDRVASIHHIDSRDWAIAKTMPLDGWANSIEVHPDSGAIYVLLAESANQVVELQPETLRKTWVFLTGRDPVSLTFGPRLEAEPIHAPTSPARHALRPPYLAHVIGRSSATLASIRLPDASTAQIARIARHGSPIDVIASSDRSATFVLTQENLLRFDARGDAEPVVVPLEIENAYQYRLLAESPNPEELFVVASNGEIVGVDRTTGQRSRSFEPLHPNHELFVTHVLRAPDAELLYVTSSGDTFDDRSIGRLSYISSSTGAVVKSVDFCDAAQGIAVSADGRIAYIAGYSRLFVVDLQSAEVVAVVPVPGAIQKVAASPDGQLLYTTSLQWNGGFASLVVVDTRDYGVESEHELPFPGSPRALALTPDGGQVIVATDADVGFVGVFDTATSTWTTQAMAGDQPVGVTVLAAPKSGSRPTPSPTLRPAANTGSECVYIAYSDPAADLSALDPATGELTSAVVGARWTRDDQEGVYGDFAADVTMGRDGRTLYVPMYSHPEGAGVLLMVDAETLTPIGRVVIFGNPRRVLLSSDERTAWVGNLSFSGRGSISVVDLTRRRVERTIALDDAIDTMVGTADESALYVRHSGYCYDCRPSLTVVDLFSGDVWAKLFDEDEVAAIAAAADGRHVYAAHHGRAGRFLSLIDSRTDTVVRAVALDDFPNAIAESQDGRYVYVAAGYFRPTVAVVNATTLAVEEVIAIPVDGRLTHLRLFPDGRSAYAVVDGRDDVVVRVDLESRSVAAVISMELAQFAGISDVVVARDGASAFVPHGPPSTLAVLDSSSDTIVERIALPTWARAVTVGEVRGECGTAVAPDPTASSSNSGGCQLRPSRPVGRIGLTPLLAPLILITRYWRSRGVRQGRSGTRGNLLGSMVGR